MVNMLVLGVLVVNLIHVCVIIRVYFYRGSKGWLKEWLDEYCSWYQKRFNKMPELRTRKRS